MVLCRPDFVQGRGRLVQNLVPLSLSPHLPQQNLSDYLLDWDRIHRPLQHRFRHRNHFPMRSSQSHLGQKGQERHVHQQRSLLVLIRYDQYFQRCGHYGTPDSADPQATTITEEQDWLNRRLHDGFFVRSTQTPLPCSLSLTCWTVFAQPPLFGQLPLLGQPKPVIQHVSDHPRFLSCIFINISQGLLSLPLSGQSSRQTLASHAPACP